MIHFSNYLQKARLDASASPSLMMFWSLAHFLWSQTKWCKVYWLAPTSEIQTHRSSEASRFDEDLPVRMQQPAKPSLLFRQAAPNPIYWPVPLAAEHRSWTALRKPPKSKINLAGPKFSPCKQTCTLILIYCYSTLIIWDLPLCRAD